jgi:hypothetical protein
MGEGSRNSTSWGTTCGHYRPFAGAAYASAHSHSVNGAYPGSWHAAPRSEPRTPRSFAGAVTRSLIVTFVSSILLATHPTTRAAHVAHRRSRHWNCRYRRRRRNHRATVRSYISWTRGVSSLRLSPLGQGHQVGLPAASSTPVSGDSSRPTGAGPHQHDGSALAARILHNAEGRCFARHFGCLRAQHAGLGNQAEIQAHRV